MVNEKLNLYKIYFQANRYVGHILVEAVEVHIGVKDLLGFEDFVVLVSVQSYYFYKLVLDSPDD